LVFITLPAIRELSKQIGEFLSNIIAVRQCELGVALSLRLNHQATSLRRATRSYGPARRLDATAAAVSNLSTDRAATRISGPR
jgi:hypothetical protein